MYLIDKFKSWVEGEAPSRPARKAAIDPESLTEALRDVIDPELGLDIVSMGLIRELTVEAGVARVRMTLTTEGCPVGPWLLDEVRRVLREQGVEPLLEVEHEPPWSPDDMSPEARAELRWMGR